jgi:hypothetical protein
MLLHNGKLFQEDLFPVGIREEWLLGIGMMLVVVLAFFLILTGIAAFKRKWPVRGWVTGILAGLFLTGAVAGIALAADAAPHIKERYEATVHTTSVKNIGTFNKVDAKGNILVEHYPSSPDTSVSLRYNGNVDLSKLKINTHDGTLYIDATALDTYDRCTMLCLFPDHNLTVRVYGSDVQNFNGSDGVEIWSSDESSR